MIKVIADQNLYKLEKFLPDEVELTTYDPVSGLPDIEGFDALLLRTVSRLNQQTLANVPSSLKFVGTGSSGSDHVDIEYLKSHNISFADALGCNARAVGEYVMTALLLWQEKAGKELRKMKYGIIGVGKAGSAVAKLFDDFELDYVLYDPPRAELDSTFLSATLEEVLSCNVLTFHVPLTKSGNYPTFHWLNKEKLLNRSFELIINAARGGIIDEPELLNALEDGSVQETVIDVWENEPDFCSQMAKKAFIATPHIAGYSEQSKLNASKMVCEALCSFFGLNCPPTENLYPSKDLKLAHLKYTLNDFLTRLHPIKEYDAALRDLITRPEKAMLFAKLRTDRPFRYEYGFLRVEKEFLNGFIDLEKLGIRTI